MEPPKYLLSKTFYITISQLIQLQKVFTNQRKIKIYDQMKYQNIIIVARIINKQNYLTLTDQTSILNTVVPKSWQSMINLQLNKYYRFIFTTDKQIRIQDRSYNICIKAIHPIINKNQLTQHLSKIVSQRSSRIINYIQKKNYEATEQSNQQQARKKDLLIKRITDWCAQVNSFNQSDMFRAFKDIQNKQVKQILQHLCDIQLLIDLGLQKYEYNKEKV